MCQFITSTLPVSEVSVALAAVVEKHGLRFASLENASISAQVEPSEGYFRATRGRCDCGTPWAAGNETPPQADSARQIARLRRKGWGETKIQRWLAQQDANTARRTRTAAEHSALETPSAERWIAFLEEATDLEGIPWVGLLVHFYDGTLEAETIALRAQRTMERAVLTPEVLRDFEEDVLYKITR